MSIKNKIIPKLLHKGSHIRIIAPSHSMAILSKDVIEYAIKRFNEMGFTISFGKHVLEKDHFLSSSIKSRIADLHEAFQDTSIDGILTAIGGYNANQLLDYIDYDLIAQNPKVLCGYSDITILHNAIHVKTNLVTLYGPHFATFGQKFLDPYEMDCFFKATTQKQRFFIEPAKTWSNDPWHTNQDNRNIAPNKGYWIIQHGKATGKVFGGHLGTFNLLQGTEYIPSLNNAIILIEEDSEPANPKEFDRRLQSLLQQHNASNITGILIGRFEKKYNMTQRMLYEIISSKKINPKIPIIANVDFGHTEPHCTLPIGGIISIDTNISTPIIVEANT